MLLGDPVERARALFPEATFFSRDILLEQAAWEGVLHRINETTPFVEALECGVAFFRPHALAETSALAGQLVARIGLGPDKHVARIAAVRSAPGAVLHIREENLPRFFSQTSVAVLSSLGFDEDVPSRLALFGLTSLDKVSALTRRHLRVQFESAGEALFDLLHPASEASRVATYYPPAEVTETFALDFSTCDFVQLSSLVDWMARRVALRLGRLCCSRLALRLQSENTGCVQGLSQQRALKTPTADPGVISRATQYLLRCALESPVDIVSVDLTLSGIQNPQHAQGTLFFDRPPLRAAIERLDERFPGALKRARLVHPDAPFPEDAVRFDPFMEQHRLSS
jgi:hypothetical protein